MATDTRHPDYVTLAEGGRVVVTLQSGVTLGGLVLTVAHVRQLTAGDILDAQEEAERLVYAKDGMALVMSPARMARASLCRQVARLETADGQKHDGPLSADELARFSAVDLMRLQQAAEVLDAIPALVSEGAEKRGRAAAGSGADAPAAGPAGA